MPIKDVETEDEIFAEEPVTKIKVRSKLKGTAPKFVLQEDTEEEDEAEHSGVTTDDGIKIYDQSRVPGGRIQKINPRTKQLTYVNAKGQEIDEETGVVLNPEKYREDYSLGQ